LFKSFSETFENRIPEARIGDFSGIVIFKASYIAAKPCIERKKAILTLA